MTVAKIEGDVGPNIGTLRDGSIIVFEGNGDDMTGLYMNEASAVELALRLLNVVTEPENAIVELPVRAISFDTPDKPDEHYAARIIVEVRDAPLGIRLSAMDLTVVASKLHALASEHG